VLKLREGVKAEHMPSGTHTKVRLKNWKRAAENLSLNLIL
jgi:hypothetical protein